MKATKIIALFLSLSLLLVACGTLSQPQNSEVSEIGISSPEPELSSEPEPEVEPEPEPELKPDPEPEPEPEPEVDNSWQFDEPGKHNMDGKMLDSLHAALAYTRIHSVVTVRDGVIVDEYYAEGYDETSVFPVHSVSKSFTSALIGIAIDEGLISGVDAKLSDYLPEAVGTDKADITLLDLLTHTGGFEWYEWSAPSESFFELVDSDNWVEYVLSRRMVAQPGTTFNYTTGGTHLLTAVLQQVTGKDALEYGKEHLFGPLGIDSVSWNVDPQGVIDGGNGLVLTARDMAKFGQLFLQRGKWHEQQLVSENWVDESTSLQFAWPGYDSYGYQWWLSSLSGYDTYFAFGAWGQFIFVVPELNLVTVMTSTHQENPYLPRDFFRDYILPASTSSGEVQ